MNLAEAMNRATDAVEPPHLARSALEGARRRRVRRRVAVGTVAAVATIVGATAVVAVRQGEDRTIPVGPPSPSPTTPSQSTTHEPAVRVHIKGTQPRWDPRDVDRLPAAPASLVPALPPVVDPPATSPSLVDEPIQSAVLAVVTGHNVQLLSPDREWRSVAAIGDPKIHLSPDGTRLAITHYLDQAGDVITVADLPTGVVTEVPYPEDFPGEDFSTLNWVDESSLLLAFNGGGDLINTTDGQVTPVAYPTTSGWTVDDAGVVVESPCCQRRPVFIDWADGRPRQLPWPMRGGLLAIHATGDLVAGTWGSWVVVADRETLRPVDVLPSHDPDAYYANGPLSVIAVRDDSSVLLRVTVEGPDEGIRLVAWEPATGDLSLVSRLPIVYVTFAEGLIRRTNP